MGLIKQIDVRNSGAVAEYWNVDSFSVDFRANTAVIKMAGYLSKQHRLDGYMPLSYRTVKWGGANNPITQALMVQGLAFNAAYTKLITYNPTVFSGGNKPILWSDT